MRTNQFADAQGGVAIIGIKGRFPGANSVQALWENLKQGRETITSFSEQELRAAGIDPSYLSVPGYVPRGSVLEAIEQFDASFFGYSARDAEMIDPQQRVFLECAWECLEDAGYDPETYRGNIGVFAGSDQSSYLYQIYSNVDLSAYGYGGMMAIGNEKDYLATQVSYKLNLRGPSLNVQTSCSTSLVTVCIALQNLVHGYCDMALAGGVAISVPQKKGYWYQPGGIVSPDGHCRAFDAAGQGTVVGNGVGVVLLKRLSDAIADGDKIEAVIKGFALNNDGSAKVGYTAPSIDGQAQAIGAAQRMADVEPDTIGYIEAHGTATSLGDPIEVAALTKAFRERTKRRQFCAIGSLKSNVGHLSSAAGIAGLIKAALAVKHGQVPPTVHYEKPNPQIDFASSPFFVASSLTDWPLNGGPRRAGVSSFGVGGTNAHIILEEAPAPKATTEASDKQILVLSARTPTALEKVTDNLISHVEADPDLDLADVVFTCQIGRKSFPHRRAMVFDRADRPGFLAALKTRDAQRVMTNYSEHSERPVIFMFSGQGTQYVGMGSGLYDSQPTFRHYVDKCSEILKGEIGLDLRDILYRAADPEAATAQLRRTEITQPALFTIEYALAKLWMEWGCTPKAMLGHSIGEYVAACLAGVMTLEDALSVVAMRGRLMGSMPGGSMLSVPLPEAALQPLLSASVSLAAVNAPTMCVLAGPTPAIDAIEQELKARNVPSSRLHTSHAFHSSMMDPVLEQFTERLRRVKLSAPEIPYLSNVTGGWITTELATSPEFWASHLRHTVRFADNLRELMAFPDLALIEVGPGQTLGMLARQQGSRLNSQLLISSLRTVHEQIPDLDFLFSTAARLWLGGVRLDWRGMHKAEVRRILALPTYPFDRQRYWLGPLESAGEGSATATTVPTSIDGAMAPAPATAGTAVHQPPITIDDWFYVPSWRPAVTGPKSTKPVTGRWLVFADGSGVGEAVAEQLRAAGTPVSTVQSGAELRAAEGDYVVRPGDLGDYVAMVTDLRKRGEMPAFVLHLRCLDSPPGELGAAAAFDEAQTGGYLSLIALAQAFAKVGGSETIQVGVVTDRLQVITGDEEPRSLQATVSGACKVINQEYPRLKCRWIDVVATQPRLADALVAELSREPFEPTLGYRNGRRWVESHEPIRLEASADVPALLQDGDVYLVTGGLGNIGLIFAEAIARDVKAKLVLTGRSSFPEQAGWKDYLAANGSDATSHRIRKLQEICKAGTEVMVAQVDVTDRAEMRKLVDRVSSTWGKISGVIHGAAHLAPDAFGPIKEIDRKSADLHFGPKDHGLLVLEEVLSQEKPKFWMLLSSLSAVLGGLGLASYAASNAFLDAEARRRGAAAADPWISVNWDAWDFGPQAKSGVVTVASGSDAFRRILGSGLRQVVVSTTPLAPRVLQWVRMEAAEAAPRRVQGNGVQGNGVQANGLQGNGAAGAAAGGMHARPDLSNPFVAPRDETERSIAEVWSHFLGVEPVGINDKFFDLGGHSLLAIQLLSRLREIFDMDIPVQRLFEAPTVAELARSIERDRKELPDGGKLLTAPSGDLEEVLSLVEKLSDAEVEALLSNAEAEQVGATRG